MNKPQLLLHICCAPDEAWGITVLREKYDLQCFFCNPNIAPLEEYSLRLKEALKVAKHFNVPFEADEYQPETWKEAIAPHINTPEGGERCRACFLLRLKRTAKYCAENGISEFTTVMSVSPHKKITMLNETGHIAANQFSVSYLETNFKKNDGFKKSIHLSNALELYRQDYCGCSLSKAERDIRVAQRKNSSD